MKYCSSCKETKPLASFPSKEGQHYGPCNSCTWERRKARGTNKPVNGKSDMRRKVQTTRASAVRRRLPFQLTEKFLKSLLEEQGHKCPLTGRELTTANWSIDRLSNDEGYVEGNVRFVVSQANNARGQGSDEELLQLALDIVKTLGSQ